MLKLIDSSYTGPDELYRNDKEKALLRAQSDLELASAMARDQGKTRLAVENRRKGKASLPLIKARIDALTK